MTNAQAYLTYLRAVRGVPEAVAGAAQEAVAALLHVHAAGEPEDVQRQLYLAHTLLCAAHVHAQCPSIRCDVTASLRASHAFVARAHHVVAWLPAAAP